MGKASSASQMAQDPRSGTGAGSRFAICAGQPPKAGAVCEGPLDGTCNLNGASPGCVLAGGRRLDAYDARAIVAAGARGAIGSLADTPGVGGGTARCRFTAGEN